MTPEEQARAIVQRWLDLNEIAADAETKHPLLVEIIAAALAERDREIGEALNRAKETEEDAFNLRAERNRSAGADEGYLVGWAIKNGWLNPQDAQALRTRRDALVAAVENWRKAAIRILDGETEAASEFEDAGIVLDAALAEGKGVKG